MAIPPTKETSGGPEKAPEPEEKGKWGGHVFRKGKGVKTTKILSKEGAEALPKIKHRFSVRGFCEKIRSIAQQIYRFFLRKPSEQEPSDFTTNPRAAFGQLVDKDRALSRSEFLSSDHRYQAEEYLFNVIGDRQLNGKLREEQLSLKKQGKELAPSDQVLLQMSYLTNEDFEKAREATEKFDKAFEELELGAFLNKSKKLLDEQEELFSALGKEISIGRQTNTERLFSEEIVSFYEELKEISGLEDSGLQGRLQAHLEDYKELQQLKQGYDEKVKKYTAPLTIADIRQIEKIQNLASLVPLLADEGIDETLEKLFEKEGLRNTFKMVLEASETWKTLTELLCALPGYRSGDVFFDREDKIWKYTNRRGIPLRLRSRIDPRTWIRVIRTLLKNKGDVQGFFVGKNIHAGLVDVNTDGFFIIRELRTGGLRVCDFNIRRALCADAFRLKLSSMVSDENLKKLKQNGDDAYVERLLQQKYREGLSICMQRQGFLEKVQFVSIRAARALVKRAPMVAKKDQKIKWQAIPEDAEEIQNLICSEFVARVQDSVFLWVNEYFEKHFPDLKPPLFPALVESEKDYSLIYPKRLKRLIKAQGYEEVEIPMAVKLFVQETQPSSRSV